MGGNHQLIREKTFRGFSNSNSNIKGVTALPCHDQLLEVRYAGSPKAVFLKLFQTKDHLANTKKLADHLTKHSTQKKGNFCLVDYFFVVTMLLGNKSYTVGKPVYFPFKFCHICKEYAFGG